MQLYSIIKKIEQSNIILELLERSKRSENLEIEVNSRLSNLLIITALAKKAKKPLIIVVSTLDDASKILPMVELMGWSSTFIYPSGESSLYSKFNYSKEIVWGQFQVLSELIYKQNNSDICIITTERSFQPHLPPKEYFNNKCIKLIEGFEKDFEELSVELTNLGYIRKSTVVEEGTWSRRGNIIDIFPVNSELPIRLEFFGNELQRIREFDSSTQISQEPLKECFITPIGVDALISELLVNKNPSLLENYKAENNFSEDNNSSLLRLLAQCWSNPASLNNYLPINSFIVLEEEDQCRLNSDIWIDHAKQEYLIQAAATNISELKKETFILSTTENIFLELKRYNFIIANSFTNSKSTNLHKISHRNIDTLPNQFGRIALLIKEYLKDKYSVFLISAQPSRVVTLLEEHDCNSKLVINHKDYNSINSLIKDNTPVALKCSSEAQLEGVALPALRVLIITDKEFFGQQNLFNTSYIRRRRKSTSNTIDTNKLHKGDYVVHRNHGIGKYKFIEKITIAGETRDYLVVSYTDGLLRVAADQLSSLSRYRSSTDSQPKINKLGGTTWNNTKERAKKSLRKVAIDLIQLYAERNKQKGYSYPEDGPWQKELEDSFPYEPTKDQLRAVEDVKKDMQRNKPMDRLVCGDVGFGKTEIAIRAIFKAITSGKQIALLAPTTILAQQHWRTISERFAPYPINIGLLNRFKTTIEKKLILDKLEKGKIDAIVGTHQLLSPKVKFANLGLLVVDEEQRFGVNQKEKIKTIKKSVDVLTLSATPIPRTLYMSLAGVREMSLLKSPPPQRRSIKTNLCHMDLEITRSAISQELDRGGQIFYVVPRVDGIEEVANKISKLIPSIKLLIAHGQMDEGELENAMIAFNAGEADLMICTTIIESGLDIPRVNTIIIEDSHKFGLAQLYQLRGRVGRSGIQAYAWLFYPDKHQLSTKAKQRLNAIKEFTSLGSGYQLSMRDMEIRGVGNLLGVEQSGQMEVIGFDMYMEFLQEALADIQGQNIPKVDETQVDLPITAFIPADYILDSDEKILAYRTLSECKDHKQLIEVAANWIDRYGPLPKPVDALIQIMRLKIKSSKCGFTRIKMQKPNIIMETMMDEPAFRLLRQGLAKHLHGRLIYTKKQDNSEIIVRGLGLLPNNKQIEELTEWLEKMETQIPSD